MVKIHPMAYIDPAARLGEDVEIGPFCNIQGDVAIGDRTRLISNVNVMDGATIGADCTLFPGSVVGAIPQDLKFKGEKTTAVVGDRCTLRECVTVNRGTASKGTTVVGNDCLIMAYCHVAHDCRVHDQVIMSNATQLAGEVEVDECAVIGGGSLIHQFCHIGAYVMIQGGALINKDIPPYIKAAREPIAYAGINIVGLRRRGFSTDEIREIQDVYHLLFMSGMNNSDALKTIREVVPESKIRDRIIDFVRASDRGILRSYNG